ncbi:hypothetical protein HMPREF3034_01962 [Prevotella sp. DNF00663]|uniref:DUF4954 family protein n=1 Tax=unclassified Prevotella TaxID=2638335 RepID=UPI0005138813|nr:MULTISPECIES: DUF4954 family protein [unclassified Prevotella]KGI60002.1 hypothetical protein HMPREF0671_08495 [Prevotella sp. S7 MS 2]KXB80887.1 hypothetical protein HMPREF3034_01962 [Prevotella sp. DNF00663]
MRQLTDKEIITLEENNCWAEDWTAIQVAEDFMPNYLHRVMFYGDIELGEFTKNVEVSRGFMKHSGINNATLRNVSIGDNCLIENIGTYINNYTIGDDCYIGNVAMMETAEGATYGEGNPVSVLNESGEGNLLLFHNLSSQLAALMVLHAEDKLLRDALRRLIHEDIERRMPDRGIIGNNVKIVNTKEITNTIIHDDCEISGAERLCDCTIISSPNASVFIGTAVICENSIICDGSSITNGVKIQDCFVGEACQLNNGFTATSSVFFANSNMSKGEVCSAFCGPFSTNHHQNSLLLSGMFSFYNAGSATNFSNDCGKLGAIHHGILERGCTTESGCQLVMPVHIGAFSTCSGVLTHHPDTLSMPFSQLKAVGDTVYLKPGYTLCTAGLYRDIHKWVKRDVRVHAIQRSIVDFDWLNPVTIGSIVEGKEILERLREASGEHAPTYYYHEHAISAADLKQGIQNYDMALHIYMGAVLKQRIEQNEAEQPYAQTGCGQWSDLAGMLLPKSEERMLINDIKHGDIETVQDIIDRLVDIHESYREYEWAWTYRLILNYYHLTELTDDATEQIMQDGIAARHMWADQIRKNAEQELTSSDVEKSVLSDFINMLSRETEQNEENSITL